MIWILCVFILFLSSCESKSQERHYKEIIIEAPSNHVPVASAFADSPVGWVVPEGWEEEAGAGMRLVTFHLIDDPRAIDCYFTALAGPAGGLQANLERWLGQLGLQASDDHLKQLSRSVRILKTKDGLEIKVFDFTALQVQSNLSDKSMLAAMIVLDQTTVFVKMTGSIQSMKENKDSFLKLLRSIVRK